jgi:hypothetical protein
VYLPQQILSLLLVEIHCRARDGDMNSQVQDQPRQHKETPSQKERKKEREKRSFTTHVSEGITALHKICTREGGKGQLLSIC